MKVAIDSQCYSYLIAAFEGIGPPDGQLASQKISLVRTFFYVSAPYVPDTVRAEYLRISDVNKLQLHTSWSVVFPDLHTDADHSAVMRRAQMLLPAHRKLADCQIVSECEMSGVTTLLSYDNDLINRLAGQTSITIIRPLDHWVSLGLDPNASPALIPSPGNPLGAQTWWRM